MKLTNLLALCALLLSPGVNAQDIDPQVLKSPQPSQVEGRNIDILGLMPGMGLEEARSAMSNFLAMEPNESEAQTHVFEGSVSIASMPYVEWLYGSKGSENLEAKFSGIGSGNQLVLVRRDAEYGKVDEAPLFDAFIASLLEKYGEPSFRDDRAVGSQLMWTYKNGAAAACDPTGDHQCLEPENAITLLDQAAQSYDVIVSATVLRARADDARVSMFKMRSTDLSVVQATGEADQLGLQPALDAAVAQSTRDAPVPDV